MAKNIDIPNGWEVKKLGEVFKKINIKNKDKLITQVLTNSALYGVIAQEEFFDKSIATKENINNYYILNIDDFIYNPRISKFAPAGPISRNKYKIGCVSPLYTVFKMTANYNIDFYELYFKSNIWNRQAYNIANFGARFDRMNITDTDFFNMPIPIPPLAEQEKIAEILSLWDKAIEHTKELIAYKEKQKKGLMQNLLTGKKRLSGFTDEWKTTKLGEICKITTGKLDANAMEENGIYPFFTCAKDVYRINTFAFDTEALLISGNGANVGYIHYYMGKFNAYQRTYVLNNFKEYIIFLKYYLENYLHIRIDKEKKAGNTPYITLDTISNMNLYIPQYQNEQKTIADILCKADEEIELLNKQLDLYTEQKKGLMQNLLTGKVRVTV